MAVVTKRDWETMQSYADELPFADRFCSDGLEVYSDLLWPPNSEGKGSEHVVSMGKEETHTIESVNSNLRTYLGRLKRKSRCFNRCLNALRRALRLFVWYYNKRQRVYLANPRLKGNLSLYF